MIIVRTCIASNQPPASARSGRGTSPGRRLALLSLAVLALTLGRTVPCRAGLVIEAPTLYNVAPGSSGSFDVLLMNTNGPLGASYNIAGDSLDLVLSGSPGFSFTNVTINTSVSYLYSVSATSLPGSDPLNFGITFPNMGFTVVDSDGADPFFQTVGPGATFGLARVFYTVDPTASGTDTITIASLNVGTSLSDINLNPFPFTAVNGVISTASVPEPSTLIQTGTAVLIGLGLAWRRRRLVK